MGSKGVGQVWMTNTHYKEEDEGRGFRMNWTHTCAWCCALWTSYARKSYASKVLRGGWSKGDSCFPWSNLEVGHTGVCYLSGNKTLNLSPSQFKRESTLFHHARDEGQHYGVPVSLFILTSSWSVQDPWQCQRVKFRTWPISYEFRPVSRRSHA